jgi:hypothetical protein
MKARPTLNTDEDAQKHRLTPKTQIYDKNGRVYIKHKTLL